MTATSTVTLQLATGESIQVELTSEGPFGSAGGTRIVVRALRGTLLVAPSAANAVTITTPAGMQLETLQTDRVLAERDK